MAVGALLHGGPPYRAGWTTDERSGSESAITIPGTGDHDAPESVIRIERNERSRSAGTGDQDGPEPSTRVERALLQGAPAHGFATDLWTLPRVATVIARLTGERFHPGHVWYLLRALNWSVQRPGRRARERDDEAVTAWAKKQWRRVKNRPAPARLARLRRRKRPLAPARCPADVGSARGDRPS
ncbi:MAG: helix-turn-helix domain-containing protein [Candidatus Rokuibacteriota bacterium]